MELYRGLATCIEALLKGGYAVNSYVLVDIDPFAHAAVPHRIAHLRLQYPHLLPLEVIKDRDFRMPMDIRTISPDFLTTTFPEGVDLLLASHPMLAHHLPRYHRVHSPMGPDVVRHILHLILNLSEAQSEGVGYIWNPSELNPQFANTLSLLGQGTLLDASKCGSGAYRNTRI